MRDGGKGSFDRGRGIPLPSQKAWVGNTRPARSTEKGSERVDSRAGTEGRRDEETNTQTMPDASGQLSETYAACLQWMHRKGRAS